MPYKFIEHTADIAVEVEGRTIEELFISSFYAWKDAVIEILSNRKNDHSKKFLFNANSIEELLIEMLSELNYQLYTKKWIALSIKKLMIQKHNGNYHLEIEVLGQSFNPNYHFIKEEIKAVTFHQMKIEERNGNYFTRIVFDI